MSKSSEKPKTLSEAIAQLESAGQAAAQDLKARAETDFQQVIDAVVGLKPYLDDVKEAAGAKGKEAKDKVESEIKQNPWLIIGVTGLIAFFIGWLLGQNSKKRE